MNNEQAIRGPSSQDQRGDSIPNLPRLLTPTNADASRIYFRRIASEIKNFLLSYPLDDPNREFTLKFDEANLSLCTVEVVSIKNSQNLFIYRNLEYSARR